jgi:hypothetical protein
VKHSIRTKRSAVSLYSDHGKHTARWLHPCKACGKLRQQETPRIQRVKHCRCVTPTERSVTFSNGKHPCGNALPSVRVLHTGTAKHPGTRCETLRMTETLRIAQCNTPGIIPIRSRLMIGGSSSRAPALRFVW